MSPTGGCPTTAATRADAAGPRLQRLDDEDQGGESDEHRDDDEQRVLVLHRRAFLRSVYEVAARYHLHGRFMHAMATRHGW
jgi:hypothetical protein